MSSSNRAVDAIGRRGNDATRVRAFARQVLVGRFPLVLGFLVTASLSPLSHSARADEVTLGWKADPSVSNSWRVEVRATSAMLKRLREARWTDAQWQKLLTVVTVSARTGREESGRPAMVGHYSVDGRAAYFSPSFPLEPGLSYRAALDSSQWPGSSRGGAQPTMDATFLVTSTFRVPPRPAGPKTRVVAVYPTAREVPENLLKFYVHFSRPMSGGRIYEHIRIVDEDGRVVELPFLEINEELWNPEMTRLTLFIDPGRIKRGVTPLEEIGPALQNGRGYRLVIDGDWKDADGAPLREGYRKEFKVGPPDRTAIDLARWEVEAPRSETLRPLLVTFDRAMDHALASRVIQVMRKNPAGGAPNAERWEGQVELGRAERTWKFTPTKAWQAGEYQLVIQSTLEDLAGNNIGKPFEVDLFDTVQSRNSSATLRRAFVVK